MFTFIGWQNINNMQYYCIKYVTNILTALVGILLLTMPTSAGLDYYIENITAGFILSIITSISIIYRLFCSNKVVIYNADILIFVGLITFLTLSFFSDTIDIITVYYGCILFLFYILIRIIRPSASLFYILFLCGILQSTLGIMQGSDILSSNHELFKYTGSFNNPGVLAGYLIIPIFIGLYLVQITSRKQLKLLLALGLLFMIWMLFLTQSRASWIAFICGIMWLIISNPNFKQYLTKRLVLPILGGVLLILTIVLSSVYCIKPDSADGRMLIWQIALERLTENPCFGHGISSFQSNYMILQSSWFQIHTQSLFARLAGNSTYAFNEYIRLLYEVGIFGFLLYISIFSYILYLSFKTNIKTRYCGGGLIAFFVFSFFSYPFSIIHILVLVAFLAAIVVNETNTILYEIRYKIGAKIISLLLISGLIIFLCNDYIIRKRADVILKKALIDKSLIDPHFHSNYYSYMKNTPDFVLCYAKNLFNGNQYERVIPILEQAYKLKPSSHIAIDLGVCYQSIKNYDSAEKMFTTASFMTPSHLLAQYNLFKLYIETNQQNKTVEIGTGILKMEAKVVNTTVLRIRKQVKDFLQHEKFNQSERRGEP